MATTKQNTQSGSTSSTTGGSTSTTSSSKTGGSTSYTTGHSTTNTNTEGGATSNTTGKSYASGQVSENTQNMFNQYGQEYVQGSNVTNAYNQLQAALDSKPTWQSTYAGKLDEIYNQIMNREKFNYNFNEDSMYQMYKDQYSQMGQQAMQDTMGQAAALSGGYGSSYAQTAGQQQYQNYLTQLNNMIPELRNQAYQEYQQEGQDLLNKYDITNSAYNNEYGQYRDSVSDWQNERAFNQSAYEGERNFDWNQYEANRNYWTQQYWNEKNAEQSNESASNQNNWSKSNSETNSESVTNTNYWENGTSTTNQNSWSNTDQNGWSNSNSQSTGTGSGTSTASAVQFGNSNSHNGVYTAQSRQAVVNSVSDAAQTALSSGKESDMKKVYSLLQDYLKNGSTGTNGEHVQYSLEDVTNIYNRAITMNVQANGARSSENAKENGWGKPLKVSEMANKLGIRQ